MENNNAKPVKLLQISDTHCYADNNASLEWSELPVYPNKSLSNLLAHLKQQSEHFEALVISGDLVQEEISASYQRVQEILQDFPLPIYVLPGNHDIPELMQTHLVAQDENIHFQLQQVFGTWQCLFLDTHTPQCESGHLSEAQYAEIEAELEQLAPDSSVLIFMHHHVLSIGSPWMDRMGLQQVERFWALMARYPQVKSVVFGHIHSEFNQQYAFSPTHSIAVYGTPATCVQVKHIDEKLRLDHARPAWRELTLHADGRLETLVNYLPDIMPGA